MGYLGNVRYKASEWVGFINQYAQLIHGTTVTFVLLFFLIFLDIVSAALTGLKNVEKDAIAWGVLGLLDIINIWAWNAVTWWERYAHKLKNKANNTDTA